MMRVVVVFALALATSTATPLRLAVSTRGGAHKFVEAGVAAAWSAREAATALELLGAAPSFDRPATTLVVALRGDGAGEAAQKLVEAVGDTEEFTVAESRGVLDRFLARDEGLTCAGDVAHGNCRRHESVDGLDVGEGTYYVALDATAPGAGAHVEQTAAALRRLEARRAQVAVVVGEGLTHPVAGRAHRVLQAPVATNGTATNGTYSAEEIARFQINLWTAVGLILLTLATIVFLCNMEVIPDSLLYAKFQADTSGMKSD